MSATVNVGMLELDRKLSKVLDCARQQPVSVSRYGSPWVWSCRTKPGSARSS